MQVNVIEQIFEIINQSKLVYCVVSNVNNLPKYCESDIDIVYFGASERQISALISMIEEKTNTVCLQMITTGYKEYSYMLAQKDGSKIKKIQLDFFEHLYSKDYGIIMFGDEILAKRKKNKCFYVPTDITELIYTFYRRAAKGKFDSSHCKLIHKLFYQIDVKTIEYSRAKEPEMWRLVERILKENSADQIDKAELEKCVRIRTTNNMSLSKKMKVLKFRMLEYYPRRLFRPLGMSISFLAPDGAGKTTIINAINADSFYREFFFSIDNKYFRPRLFKNLGHYNSIHPKEESKTNSEPHNVKLNNSLKSFLRFMFYNLDFVLGNLILIYPQKVKRNLIIFDRYYYDYFADMKRYQYSLPQWMPALFSWIIPKPDIVFVLDAAAEILYHRKQELTINEIDKVSSRLKENRKYYGNSYVINVDRSIEDIVDEIRLVIFEYLRKRRSGRDI